MSYLDTPRLTFAGQFIANPSTINNTPTNYNMSVPVGDLAWNPNGKHNFSFNECEVTSIVTDAGPATSGDPIIGAALASVGPAVLVDLDTEQQGASQIIGLVVQISAGGATITGKLTTINFVDMFVRPRPRVPGDGKFSAVYQSVLTNVEWKGKWTSPFVDALQKASGSTLSIHFVVDGYHDDAYQQGHFTVGRVVGTIGPYLPGEPTNFVNGRLLRPTGVSSPDGNFNFAYAKTDLVRKKITMDFGNAVPSHWPPDELFPVFTVQGLQAAILPSAGGNPIILGAIDTTTEAYTTTAFVQEFSLDDAAMAAIGSSPTAILTTTPGGQVTLAQENATGAYANYDQYVFRLNPGDTGKVTVWANIFEKPAENETIPLQMYLDMLGGPPGSPAVGVPLSAIQFPSTITTDDEGKATFTISAGNPANPRIYIDGQVYGVQLNWAKDTNPDPWAFVSVKIFDAVTAADNPPTWWTDVLPILNQYAVLYPAMRQIILINDYKAVVKNLKPIVDRLTRPQNDPLLMPITRELSRSKRQIILDWAKSGHPEGMKPPQ